MSTKFEVFRIEPEVGENCYEYAEYEYAESTSTKNSYLNQKYFTNIRPLYVGKLIRYDRGGWGDGSWRTDYFQDNTGKEHVVNYSYEGRTCFREVPCLLPDVPEEIITKLRE